MRIGIFLTFALSLFVLSSSARANYDSYYDIVLCDSCTSEQSFKNSGSSAAGSGYNGDRLILVINSNTRQYRNVLVTNTPPGQIPLGGQGQQTQAAESQIESERPAEIFRLPGNLTIDEFNNSAPTLVYSGSVSAMSDRPPTTQGGGSRSMQSSSVDPVFPPKLAKYWISRTIAGLY